MDIYKIRDRRSLEQSEAKLLSPFAAKSADGCATRLIPEDEHAYRTSFQRDRDRIIHSRAFRRLKHKRQVFLTSYGDHYRTRLTHTVEVSQLSRTMARALGLNEDLAEAIGLAHDLGHTPFGHIGEVVLDKILKGGDSLDGTIRIGDVGGFKHNYQSVRIVDLNEKKYDFDGLNLTAPVREGILKHTRLRRDHLNFPDFRMEGLFYDLDHAITLEGQIVAICDEIAQRTHDLEDGIRAGYVTLDKVRQLPLIRMVDKSNDEKENSDSDFIYRNRLVRKLVDFLVTDVLQQTIDNIKEFYRLEKRYAFFDRRLVWFSNTIDPLQAELDRFIMKEIISKAAEKRSDERAESTIRHLFKLYFLHPNLLPVYRLEKCANPGERGLVYDDAAAQSRDVKKKLAQNPLFARAVGDHIAGMTDFFAEKAIQTLSGMSHEELSQYRADIETLML